MNRARLLLLLLFALFASSASALTLKESIDFALKNNPAVLSAQKKFDAANARLSQAMGAFLPTIKFDGNYGKSYSQPQTVQIAGQNYTFGTDAATDTRGWSASFSQPLFFAALFPGYQIAKKSAELTREDLRKSSQETAFNAAQAYFNVLKSEKFRKLSQQAKEMAQSHHDQVKIMLASGAATQADFLRAQVQLSNSEVALSRAENALALAKNVFNSVLGRRIDEDFSLADQEFAPAQLPGHDELLASALNNRPEWRQFVLGRQISEENLRVAQTAYLPTVVLSGSTGNRFTEYPTYKSDVNSWNVAGAASWTLFDGLGIQNRIREAAANLEANRAIEEQVKNGIALEVRDAYLNLKTAIETIGSAKKAVELAEENYHVSTRLYNSGIGTNLEVISAQVTLTQARMNYFQSVYDLEIAKAKISKAIGKENI